MLSSQSSVPESLTRFNNLLLTGPPGCGKTTVLERVVEHLGDLRLAGFLTLELREHGQRVGFEAVGLGGRRVILAHVRALPGQIAAWVKQRMAEANTP